MEEALLLALAVGQYCPIALEDLFEALEVLLLLSQPLETIHFLGNLADVLYYFLQACSLLRITPLLQRSPSWPICPFLFKVWCAVLDPAVGFT